MKQFKRLQQKIPLFGKLVISIAIIAMVFFFGGKLVYSQDGDQGDFTLKMDITATSVGYTEGEDLGLFVDWTTEEANDYGYKIDREYNGKKPEHLLILNPFPLGIDNLANGGQFFDNDVKLGETYTYYIYAFDRAGNEAEPVKVSAKVTRPKIEKPKIDACLEDEIREESNE